MSHADAAFLIFCAILFGTMFLVCIARRIVGRGK